MAHQKSFLQLLAKNLPIIFGLVLIWRGIWDFLDLLDHWFFGGRHFWSAIGGFFLGIALIYLPDKDLKEIEKL